MSLIDFWSNYTEGGIHPDDLPDVGTQQIAQWTPEMALQRGMELSDRQNPITRQLHIGLCPQPFFGDARNASVYLLFGNPGLSIQDYADEAIFGYADMLASNLRGEVLEFGPLTEAAIGTSARTYWESTMRSLIRDTSEAIPMLGLEGARQLVMSKVCVIEAGAYHSARFPPGLFLNLASASAAFDFVHGHVLARVRSQEAVVFVWRQSAFWALNPEDGICHRPANTANGRYLLTQERRFIVDHLRHHYLGH